MTGKEISVPFRADMRKATLEGYKIATSRNSKYGGPGDFFMLGGRQFVLVSVTRQYLGTIASARFKEEGFTSPEEFERIWAEIHPCNGWEPHRRVWFHEFEEVK